MDEFTSNQIEEAQSNLNGIEQLLKIERAKIAPNVQKIKYWEIEKAKMEDIISKLRGNKSH